jgi:hypothetical protein
MLKVTESPSERIVRGAAGASLLIFAYFLEGPYDIFQCIFGISLLVFGGLSLATGLVSWRPMFQSSLKAGPSHRFAWRR